MNTISVKEFLTEFKTKGEFPSDIVLHCTTIEEQQDVVRFLQEVKKEDFDVSHALMVYDLQEDIPTEFFGIAHHTHTFVDVRTCEGRIVSFKELLESSFKVEVCETLIRTMIVFALNEEDAVSLVETEYKEGNIVLDSDDFYDYKIQKI